MPNRASTQADRKFNAVLYGIPECSKGTKKHDQPKKDLTNVISAISHVDRELLQLIHKISVWRNMYKESSLWPRPAYILFKITRTIDVICLLYKRSSFPNNISIKPHMSQAECTIESLLMKKRWCHPNWYIFIDRKSIIIQAANIYVNNKLHGKVCKSTFTLSSELSSANNCIFSRT